MFIRRDKAIKLLRQAQAKAVRFSKDTSTKVGAVFACPDDFTVLSEGYNGMPRGVDESVSARMERPLKYSYIEHSERNGIYNKVQPLLRGCTVVMTGAPTFNCARAIIAVGVAELVIARPPHSIEQQRIAEMLAEADIKVRYFDWEGPESETLLFDEADDSSERHRRKLQQNLCYARDHTAIWSKDPQAATAVFLAADTYTVLTQGYSGMPRGADDSKISRYLSEERAYWVETCVCNAIYNAARPLFKGSIVCCTFLPCAECARALIQVGVVGVVTPRPDYKDSRWARWAPEFARANPLFQECNLSVMFIEPEELAGSPLAAGD